MKKKIKKTLISRDHIIYKRKSLVYSLVSYIPKPITTPCRWYFFISLSNALLSSTESGSLRKYIRKKTKRRGSKVAIRIESYVHLTKRPSGIRMGSGKGSKVYKSVMPITRGYQLASIRKLRDKIALRIETRYRCKFSSFFKMRFIKTLQNLNVYSNYNYSLLEGNKKFNDYGIIYKRENLYTYDSIPEVIIN